MADNDLHFHFYITNGQDNSAQLERIETLLMATKEELSAKLVESNTVTNSIADDIAALKAQALLGLNEAESNALGVEIDALVARLRQVDAEFTPETPEGPVTPEEPVA